MPTPDEIREEQKRVRRKWAERDAREDPRKEIEQILADVHEESITGYPQSGVPLLRTTARFASLLVNLYYRVERETAKVVNLTWGLFWLTVALLFLTAVLAYYARKERERDDLTTHRPVQQENYQLTVPY